jgi:hypothetical protein
MDIRMVRQAVKGMYPNQTWATQVDRMADDQVFAIYMKNVEKPAELPIKEKPPEQGTLF